ncbi:MAG: phosphoribosylformylglycinamidine synthase, partial [Methylomonas sp.]
MLIIPGTPALSRFRLDKLLAELQAVEPGITAVNAVFQHFVQLDGEFANEQSALLRRLLDYGFSDAVIEIPAVHAFSLWVAPRAGSISPWSSKATEIAERCGLTPVRRIERGVEYRLGSAIELDGGRRRALAAVLHDRMLQQVVEETA